VTPNDFISAFISAFIRAQPWQNAQATVLGAKPSLQAVCV
jgi:hypothetical protein